jgi:ribosomal protein S18 acetylase RimI-like enzyme
MQLRRSTQTDIVYDPPASDWWDASVYGNFERVRLQLRFKHQAAAAATATAWYMDTYTARWGVRAVGLTDVYVLPEDRRQGVATFLLAELFRHLKQQGVSRAEVQCRDDNTPAVHLAQRLGFTEVTSGTVYRKDASPPP